MSSPFKLAVFATHPIQYHAPWFKALASNPACESKVYFGCIPDAKSQGTGFGVSFEWDTPLLDGYDWEVLANYKKKPGINGFFDSIPSNIRQVLKRDRPDAMLITGWNALVLLQALFWGRILNVPCIVRGDSSGLKRRSVWIRALHGLLLRSYSVFLVVGKSNRMFYKIYHVADKKLIDCPHFIDNARFVERSNQLRGDRNTLRQNIGIKKGSFCFVYAGKLNYKKRIMDQINALKIALKTNSNICLLVVGDGELMEEARNMVLHESLPVIFAGFMNQSEISKAYVAADCIVLSSDYDETWGLVVNEAMVSGLPAIVSDRAGCSLDLICNGETGFSYPFGNYELLAQCMLEISSNPGRAKFMGNNARKMVLEKYSVERAVEAAINAVEYVTTR